MSYVQFGTLYIGFLHFFLHVHSLTYTDIEVKFFIFLCFHEHYMKEQDKPSDIEQQPPFGDRK